MARTTNIETQERAAAHLNAGEIDTFVDTLFAEDALDHDPGPGQGPGREGFRAFFRALTSAFPDAQLVPETVVADDEHVCLAYTLTGHHRGDFHGVAATGNRVEVRGVQIARFRDGRIVERWDSTDELGILQQLGAVPVTPGGDEPSLLTQVRTALTPHRAEH
jgi:steroid delta-isomerase-like uncharacterized protein